MVVLPSVGTLAGARIWSIRRGCGGVNRQREEQSHDRGQTRTPPEFTENAHALKEPAWWYRTDGLAGELREWASVIRRRFQIVGVDFHRHASHDHVECEHDSKIVLLADQHTLQPCHRPRLDADSLPDHKVRMGLDSPLAETGAKRFDFKMRKRRRGSSKTNQRLHARHFEHPHSFPGIDMHKHVIGEEWQFQVHLAPVLPTAPG